MSWLYIFVIGLLTIDLILVIGAYIGDRFVKPRWPEWWERNIVAPDPEHIASFYKQDGFINNKPEIRSELVVSITRST